MKSRYIGWALLYIPFILPLVKHAACSSRINGWCQTWLVRTCKRHQCYIFSCSWWRRCGQHKRSHGERKGSNKSDWWLWRRIQACMSHVELSNWWNAVFNLYSARGWKESVQAQFCDSWRFVCLRLVKRQNKWKEKVMYSLVYFVRFMQTFLRIGYVEVWKLRWITEQELHFTLFKLIEASKKVGSYPSGGLCFKQCVWSFCLKEII